MKAQSIDRPTNIVINALTTRGDAGVRSYLRRLIELLPEKYPDDKYIFYASTELAEEFASVPDNVTVNFINLSRFRVFKRTAYEQLVLPFKLYSQKADVMYILAVTDVLLAPCPTIIRIGNMLPYTKEALKTQKTLRNRFRLWLLRLLTRTSHKTADRTLVMSNAAASILVEKLGFDQSKTVGINRGVSIESIFKEPYVGKLQPKPYILIVSHVSEYKCLGEVVDACAMLDSKLNGYTIVIAGSVKDDKFASVLKAKIADEKLNVAINLIGFVPREQLGAWIADAEFCIFPSMVETCPVTLIEMMLCKKAMIVSNQSVMPAFIGNAALLYDPRDSVLLSSHMEKLISSPSLRSQLGESAGVQVSRGGFDWDRAVTLRHELLLEVSRVKSCK